MVWARFCEIYFTLQVLLYTFDSLLLIISFMQYGPGTLIIMYSQMLLQYLDLIPCPRYLFLVFVMIFYFLLSSLQQAWKHFHRQTQVGRTSWESTRCYHGRIMTYGPSYARYVSLTASFMTKGEYEGASNVPCHVNQHIVMFIVSNCDSLKFICWRTSTKLEVIP